MNKKATIAIAVIGLACRGGCFGRVVLHRASAPDSDRWCLYGNVDMRQVSLAFNGSERIATLNVHEGDRVRPARCWAGWTRARCDLQRGPGAGTDRRAAAGAAAAEDGSRPEEVAQARAGVAAAQADAELAREQLERLQAIGRTTAGRPSASRTWTTRRHA